MTQKIVMTLERETKGALRYQEITETGSVKDTDEKGAVIGTLYLRKKAFPGKPAMQIEVTIETK